MYEENIEQHFINNKIINISKKRQITIPLKFYNQLNLTNEVECSLVNDAIVIKPLRRNTTEFSVEILKDLVSQGYSGDNLIKQFEKQNKNIKKAIKNIIEEANQIANNDKSSSSFEDLFEN